MRGKTNIQYKKSTHNKCIKNIKITSPPSKTEYEVGDNLEIDGMVISSIYSDGSNENITQECAFIPQVNTVLNEDNVEIKVSYVNDIDECICTYNVSQPITVNKSNGVTWADGTWDEISDMLDAHYSGEIDISDYWSVGDTRQVNISNIPSTLFVNDSHEAQIIELVILDFNKDILSDYVGSRDKAAITIQMRNCLETRGVINNSDIPTSRWVNSTRMGWCGNEFEPALPSELSSLIKLVNKFDVDFYQPNEKTIMTHDNKMFLLSEMEVFGVNTYSLNEDTTYAFQYEYYKNESNRIKQRNNQNEAWFLRFKAINTTGNEQNDKLFCGVNQNGEPYTYFGTLPYGLSIAMCI